MQLAPRPLSKTIELRELAATGASSDVWHAEHLATGRSLAVKVLRLPIADGWDLIASEYFLLQSFVHSCAVRVYELADVKGRPAIVMDWVDGMTMDEYCAGFGADNAPDRVQAALGIYRKLTNVLTQLHSLGVVHGDIKPRNVIIGKDGHPTLVDFGFGFRAGIDPGSAGLTPAFAHPGSMFDEQQSPAIDLYALALTTIACSNGEEARATAQHMQTVPKLYPPREAERIQQALTATPTDPLGIAVPPSREGMVRSLATPSALGVRATTIIGDTGLGKSFLKRATVQHLLASGATVASGSCHTSAEPFGGLTELVFSLKRILGVQDVPPVLRQAFPSVFPAGSLTSGFSARAGAVGAELADWIDTSVGSSDVFLVIDDTQWMDEDSRNVVRGLQSSHSLTARLLLFTRPSEHEVVPDADELHVEPLLPGEVDDILAWRGMTPSATERKHLREIGIPLVVDGWDPSHGPSQSSVEFAETIAGRGIGLGTMESRLLGLLAIHAGPAPMRQVKGIVPECEFAVGALTRIGLLESDREGWAIPHRALADAIARRLGESACHELHQAWGHWYGPQDTCQAQAFHHLSAAGDVESARPYAQFLVSAAEQRLAFHRSAELLDWLAAQSNAKERGPLKERAARNLGWAGDTAGAAERWKQLADHYGTDDAQERVRTCQTRRAEQLLRGGRVAEGRLEMERALSVVGIKIPKSPALQTLRILFHRVLMTMGIRVGRSRKMAGRIETSWAAGLGLNSSDLLASAYVQAIFTSSALAAGTPSDKCRAWSVEASYVAFSGASVHRVSRITKQLARHPPVTDYDRGMQALSLAAASYFTWQFEDALDHVGEAEDAFKLVVGPLSWERVSAVMYRSWSLYELNRHPEMNDVLRAATAGLSGEARRRAEQVRMAWPHAAWLAQAPEDAQTSLNEHEHQPGVRFESDSFAFLIAKVRQLALNGDYAASALVLNRWQSMIRKSGANLFQYYAISIARLQVTAHLSAPESDPSTLSAAIRTLRKSKPEATRLFGEAVHHIVMGRPAEDLASIRDALVLAGWPLGVASVTAVMDGVWSLELPVHPRV